MIPKHWMQFVETYNMLGRHVKIPDKFDLSGLGADLQILSETQSISEANDLYPGLAVKKHGYVPVASCLVGSGDPYFINANDDVNGPLYQIYHDGEMIDDDNYNLDDAVALVLKDYRDLLKFVRD